MRRMIKEKFKGLMLLNIKAPSFLFLGNRNNAYSEKSVKGEPKGQNASRVHEYVTILLPEDLRLSSEAATLCT